MLPDPAAPHLVLGLMSGTSLDGLDMALCRLQGHGTQTTVELLHFACAAYSSEERARLRAVVSHDAAPLADLCRLNRWLAERHAACVLEQLETWQVSPSTLTCIASHGQTIFHSPPRTTAEENDAPAALPSATPSPGLSPGMLSPGTLAPATLQLGDGDHLAVATGVLTVCDFRQKEIAAGGEGAPLAPYVDALLYSAEDAWRVLLNLGGVANVTLLPPRRSGLAGLCGDTGPGNTLIDGAVRRLWPGKTQDEDGRIAADGRVHEDLLRCCLAHPFFDLPLPRSTGLETFHAAYLERCLQTVFLGESTREGPSRERPSREKLWRCLSPADLLATLTALTAESIAEALRRLKLRLAPAGMQPLTVYASGGGVYNRSLMTELERRLQRALGPLELRTSQALGVPAEAKEALIFAVLAHETLFGEGFLVPFGSGTQEKAPRRRVRLGKIALPC